VATILLAVMTPFAYQKPDRPAKKSSARLTDEEKDIIKNREMLENLELLQNLDKVRYFELFAEEDPKKEKTPAKPAPKKDESKEK
jgi:hypothetical protein